ncbi:MAG: dimethylsulfonioproprionate lyase family protein [Candidatus Sedimenticola sp. 20ELBAFRAG]
MKASGKPITEGELYRLALTTIDSVNEPAAASFKRDFPEESLLPRQSLEPSLLPIAECIPRISNASTSTHALVDSIKNTYQERQWRQPYAEEDFGPDFFNNSAWFPIADVNGPLVYQDGLMEIMLMGPGLSYPKHKHEPEELYIVLAGRVWWVAEKDEKSPCWKSAGDAIHHTSNQVHAITSGDEPVLILNLWRGGGFQIPKIV